MIRRQGGRTIAARPTAAGSACRSRRGRSRRRVCHLAASPSIEISSAFLDVHPGQLGRPPSGPNRLANERPSSASGRSSTASSFSAPAWLAVTSLDSSSFSSVVTKHQGEARPLMPARRICSARGGLGTGRKLARTRTPARSRTAMAVITWLMPLGRPRDRSGAAVEHDVGEPRPAEEHADHRLPTRPRPRQGDQLARNDVRREVGLGDLEQPLERDYGVALRQGRAR